MFSTVIPASIFLLHNSTSITVLKMILQIIEADNGDWEKNTYNIM